MTEFADIHDLITDEELVRKAKQPNGTRCHVCNGKTQIYHRRFNGGMASTLIYMYRFGQDWFNIGRFLKAVRETHVADYTKLIFWDLMQRHPGKSEDGNKCGKYRITQEGIDFAEGYTTIWSHVYEYQSNVLAFDGEQIDIVDALAGEKFNYDELLSQSVPDELI